MVLWRAIGPRVLVVIKCLTSSLRGSQTLIMEGEMNNVRSRLRSALAAAAFVALSAQTAPAQLPPTATTVCTVLAVTSLPSVVDAPLFFKLKEAHVSRIVHRIFAWRDGHSAGSAGGTGKRSHGFGVRDHHRRDSRQRRRHGYWNENLRQDSLFSR